MGQPVETSAGRPLKTAKKPKKSEKPPKNLSKEEGVVVIEKAFASMFRRTDEEAPEAPGAPAHEAKAWLDSLQEEYLGVGVFHEPVELAPFCLAEADLEAAREEFGYTNGFIKKHLKNRHQKALWSRDK